MAITLVPAADFNFDEISIPQQQVATLATTEHFAVW
jgi:hypothetical protein